MNRIVFALLLTTSLALGTSAAAAAETGFKSCPQFFPGKPPLVADQSRLAVRELCFDAFAVLHSGISKTPVFSVERLTRDQLADTQDERRTDRFFADARLRSRERATLDDYRSSGYDRGHMAPAADMPTAQAMAQSFSLANMVPQSPKNNRGVWAESIEKATRKYVVGPAAIVRVVRSLWIMHVVVLAVNRGRRIRCYVTAVGRARAP